MININEVRAALPPFRNEKVLIVQDQGTNDIIKEILKTHGQYQADYDKIIEYFDTGNTYETCREIWEFLKYNLKYDAESKDDQSVKSPSAILHKGEKVDCKHYSLFAGGLLSRIKVNYNDPFTWSYRFVSYKDNKKIGHVFVVVADQGTEIWLDPVLTNFDEKKSYTYSIDKTPMALYSIAGIGDAPLPPGKIASVDKNTAWVSFLHMVNTNTFSIRDLIKSDMNTTYGPVREYCKQMGFDFGQLINFVNANG